MAGLEVADTTNAARLGSFLVLPGKEASPAPMRDPQGRLLPAAQREGLLPLPLPALCQEDPMPLSPRRYAQVEQDTIAQPSLASSHAPPGPPLRSEEAGPALGLGAGGPGGALAEASLPSSLSMLHMPGSKELALARQGLAPRRPLAAARSLSVSGRERPQCARGGPSPNTNNNNNTSSSSGTPKEQRTRRSLGSERDFERLTGIREAPGNVPAGAWEAVQRGSVHPQAHLQTPESGWGTPGTPQEGGEEGRDALEGWPGAPGEHQRSSSVPRGFKDRALSVSESWGAGVRLLGERLSPGAPGAPSLRTPSPVSNSPAAAARRSRSVGRESHMGESSHAGLGRQAGVEGQASVQRQVGVARQAGGKGKTTKVGGRFWGGRLTWDAPGMRHDGVGQDPSGQAGATSGPTSGRTTVGGREEANGQAGATIGRSTSGGRGRSISPIFQRWASLKPPPSTLTLPHAPAPYAPVPHEPASTTPPEASGSTQAQAPAAYGAASIPGALGNARASGSSEGESGGAWGSMRRSRSMRVGEDERGEGGRAGKGEIRSERKEARRGEAGSGAEHCNDSPRTMHLSPSFLARLFSGSVTWGSFQERSLWGNAKPDADSLQHLSRPPHSSSKKGGAGNASARKRNLDFQSKSHGSSTGHTGARPAARSASRGHSQISSRAGDSTQNTASTHSTHSAHFARSTQSPGAATRSNTGGARQSVQASAHGAHSSSKAGGGSGAGGSSGTPRRNHSMTPERDGLRVQSLTKARSLRLQSNDPEGWASASPRGSLQGSLVHPRHSGTPGDPARSGQGGPIRAQATPSPSGPGLSILGGGSGRKHLRSGSVDWGQAWRGLAGVDFETPPHLVLMRTPSSGGTPTGSRKGRREEQGERERETERERERERERGRERERERGREKGLEHSRSVEHSGATNGRDRDRGMVRAGSDKGRLAARGLDAGTLGAASGRTPAWDEGRPSLDLPEDGAESCSVEYTSGTPAGTPTGPCRSAALAVDRTVGSKEMAQTASLLSRTATVAGERSVHESVPRGKSTKGPLDNKFVRRRTRSEVPTAASLDRRGRSAVASERADTRTSRSAGSAHAGKGGRAQGGSMGSSREGAHTGLRREGSSTRSRREGSSTGTRREGAHNGTRREGSSRGGGSRERTTKQGLLAGTPSHRPNYSIDSVKSLFSLQGRTRSLSVRPQGRGKPLVADPLPGPGTSSQGCSTGAGVATPAVHGAGERGADAQAALDRHRRAASLESLGTGAPILEEPGVGVERTAMEEGPCHACGRHSPTQTLQGIVTTLSPSVERETSAVALSASQAELAPTPPLDVPRPGGHSPAFRRTRAGARSAGRQRSNSDQLGSDGVDFVMGCANEGSGEDALRPLPLFQDRQQVGWLPGMPEGVRRDRASPLGPGRALAKAQSWQERPRHRHGEEAPEGAQGQGQGYGYAGGARGNGHGHGYAMGGGGLLGKPTPGAVMSVYVTIRDPPRPQVPRLGAPCEPADGTAAVRFQSPQGTPGVPRVLSPSGGPVKPVPPLSGPQSFVPSPPVRPPYGTSVSVSPTSIPPPSVPSDSLPPAAILPASVHASQAAPQPMSPRVHEEATSEKVCVSPPPPVHPSLPSPRYRSPAMRHRHLRSASVGSLERGRALAEAVELGRPGRMAGVPQASGVPLEDAAGGGATVDAAAAVALFGRNPSPPPPAGPRASAAAEVGTPAVASPGTLAQRLLDTLVAGRGETAGEGSPGYAGAVLGSIREGCEGEGTGEGTMRARRSASVPRLRYPGYASDEVEVQGEAVPPSGLAGVPVSDGTGTGLGAGTTVAEASVLPVLGEQERAADIVHGVRSASGVPLDSREASAKGSGRGGAGVSKEAGEWAAQSCEGTEVGARCGLGEEEVVGSGAAQPPPDGVPTTSPRLSLFPRDISLDEGIAEGTGWDSDEDGKEAAKGGTPPGEAQALSVTSVESQSGEEGGTRATVGALGQQNEGPNGVDSPGTAEAVTGDSPAHAADPVSPGPSGACPSSPRRFVKGRCLTRVLEPVREHRLPPRPPGAQVGAQARAGTQAEVQAVIQGQTADGTKAVSQPGSEMGALALAMTLPLASVPGGVDLDSGFVNVTGQMSWNG